MALEDMVIVKPEQIAGLYEVKGRAETAIALLHDQDLLPLTVASLTTDRGKALLYLATWTYFSGGIHRTNFVPKITGKNDFLDYLVETHLKDLGQELKRTRQRDSIYLAQNSGAFGRLLHAMGIPKPEVGSAKGVRQIVSDDKLPHYFTDVVKSSPKYDPRRRDLLHTISKILFRDRLDVTTHNGMRKKEVALRFNNRSDESAATNYACAIVRFLNDSFYRKHYPDLFSEDQIRIWFDPQRKLYRSRLSITNEQLGQLTTRNPPILDMQVVY